MKRFYFEYNPDEGVFDVLQDGGGQEHGQSYDTFEFSTSTERDAKDAVDLLNKLYKKVQEK